MSTSPKSAACWASRWELDFGLLLAFWCHSTCSSVSFSQQQSPEAVVSAKHNGQSVQIPCSSCLAFHNNARMTTLSNGCWDQHDADGRATALLCSLPAFLCQVEATAAISFWCLGCFLVCFHRVAALRHALLCGHLAHGEAHVIFAVRQLALLCQATWSEVLIPSMPERQPLESCAQQV